MLRSFITVCVLGLTSVGAQASLLGRSALTPGGIDYQAYYDTVLNITWLADANLADTNHFGVGTQDNGTMNWTKANEWIAAMNTAAYLGKSDWRLPTVEPLNGSTFNRSNAGSYNGSSDGGYNQSEQGTAYAGSTANEMAHLYYNTLNNKGLCTPSSVFPICTFQAGWGLSNVGPFSNIGSGPGYWSGTEQVPGVDQWWIFGFDQGQTTTTYGFAALHAWAVRDGDFAAQSAVPIPPAVWLFGSALGLMGVVRRKAPV